MLELSIYIKTAHILGTGWNLGGWTESMVKNILEKFSKFSLIVRN